MKKIFFITLLGVAFTFGSGFSTYNPSADNVEVNQHTNSQQYSNENFQQFIDRMFGNYQSQNQDQKVEKQEKQETVNQSKENTEKQETNQQAQENVNNQETKQQTNHSLHAFEQKVVELTNDERAKQGLSALQIDETLSKVAREKSRDMEAKGYFSHQSPTYGSPFDMMKQYGVTYRTAGENIAKGQTTPEEVVNAWMNSEGHRANILNENFTHIGVGYVEQGNNWTQQFIGK